MRFKELWFSSCSQECRSDRPTGRDLQTDWKNSAGKTTIFKIILGLTDFANGQIPITGESTKADLESDRKKIYFFIGRNFFNYLTGDERVNGLDLQGIADIRSLITAMNRDYGTTAIVSSHILGELEQMATRFGIINQGRVSRFWYFKRAKVSAWELSDVCVLRSQNTDCRKNDIFRQSQGFLSRIPFFIPVP